MIKTWFKVEGKIQNDSRVITFTRNHTDNDADNDRTKNNVFYQIGVGIDIKNIFKIYLVFK